MVGRQVTYLDESGASVSGTVGSVSFSATGPSLKVGDAVITLSQIQSVDAAAAPGAPTP
jgi:flagellar basal-body rod modification protein FlgD